MKAAKAWCLATVVMMAGISLASCGKDEGTGDGPGMVLGGSGGGGTGGSSGNPGRAGSGGTSGGITATKLGQACVNDTQCNDPSAPGLTCVTAKDTAFGDGAPPKGICTAPCNLTNEDDCSGFGAGALCYPFGETNDGYCVEGCRFGEPELGEPQKCHNRPEFACYPALFVPTTTSCIDDLQCDAGELCDQGVCVVIEAACLPSCRGDNDCADGLYCDQSFLSGTCVPEKPTGKRLGEPCTVSDGGEPDECIGFCQPDEAGSTQGHCGNSCGLGRQCAWDPESKKYDGLCLFLSSFTTDGRDGTGDFGFCTLTCDCADECYDSRLSCQLLSSELNDTFKGGGLCVSKDAGLPAHNQCTGAGGNGAGGAGAGGAGGSDGGAGGAPDTGEAGAGAGGAPVSEGGAPATP